MANFSHEEDVKLYMQVSDYVERGARIDWRVVSAGMRRTGRRKEALQERLKTLKRTYGARLDRFNHFFERQRSKKVLQRTPRPASECMQIASFMFATVRINDVRQAAGKTHLKFGEITPTGVSAFLQGIQLNERDTFGDIGSGIGNNLAQVALQSPATKCVGIELREELVKLSKGIITTHEGELVELRKISVHHGDFAAMDNAVSDIFLQCTVGFANNLVFQEYTNHALELFACRSDNLRLLAVTRKICQCHCPTCTRLFCYMWTLEDPVQVEVNWTTNRQTMYVHSRQLDT